MSMDLAKAIDALDKFFLDVIGTVIPGLTLLIGIWAILGFPIMLGTISLFPFSGGTAWVVTIVVGYIVGHAVASIGERCIHPVVEDIANILRKIPLIRNLVPAWIQSTSQFKQSIAESLEFKGVVAQASKAYPWLQIPDNNVSAWRNVALSIAPELSHITHRFMFLSLLTLGIATSILCVLIIWFMLACFRYWGLLSLGTPVNPWIAGILFLAALPFLERRYDFYSRSMRVPFSMDPKKLMPVKDEQPKIAAVQISESASQSQNQMLRIYLAGGFHSGWHDKLIHGTSKLQFIDPRTHNIKNYKQYTLWDLEAIRHCSWVFAYLEATNPGGFALALEIGYAKALGKKVILVDEKSTMSEELNRHLGMIRACADVVFTSFDEGVEFMRKLERAV